MEKGMINSFSRDYSEARDKFLGAANEAGARVMHYRLGRAGPSGQELATDVAVIGPEDAEAALVTLSGTHGVEGFFGSATQIEWLLRDEASKLRGAAAIHIHAINPYGFAWLRRTNEDNVDLNRNWIDFTQGVPLSPMYDVLAADLCPADWSAATQARTGARLHAWAAEHGLAKLQAAVSQGQWTHRRGLFYGGTEPSWSRRTLVQILTSHLSKASRVCLIDFHTGLGPFGYAEPIIGRPRSDPGFARTRAWIGGAARSVVGDGSVSAEVKGDGLNAIPSLLPGAQVDTVALECGLRPIDTVLQALRADAWLHAHGDPLSSQAEPIKKMIRDAFHSDEPVWQGMALGQGLAACRAALGGLHDA
jgi:Protein of unknown function (DUF2817)